MRRTSRDIRTCGTRRHHIASCSQQALAAALLLLTPAIAASAQPSGEARVTSRTATPTASALDAPVRMADATRALGPVIVDGMAAEPFWRAAAVVTAFRESAPVEDGDPSMRTEARVLYDDKNVYIHIRAFDPAPDSIMGLLSRRDQRTASDYVTVLIDSYHDKRTAYAFSVNPAGVQRDLYMYNDGEEDLSWNAVWESRAVIDSLGWTAELRIPLNQLRFADRDEHSFGMMFIREVQRHGERITWPVLRRSRVGFVSQFGDVDGFVGLPPARRLEALPYLVERNVGRPAVDAAGGVARTQEHALGLDVKYGIGANFTIDATVNPDFGQVEADPAVLNLSAFEQFFQERRPFFVEGVGIFRYDIDCNDGSCTGLFYPRRIGRAPQLAGLYGTAATPQFSPIIGAAKMSGRLPSGLSVGLLDAVTGRTTGSEGRTVEPQTNYMVGRLSQEFRGGNSVLGLMATGVQRQLDASSESFLRQNAMTGGIDGRHRFAGNRYEVSGFLAASRVTGDTAAISRTQRSLVHAYARPDGHLRVDDSRTALSGTALQLALGKIGGGRTRGQLTYQRKSAGFEINDVGFLTRSDLQSQGAWFQVQSLKPGRFYRQFNMNVNQWLSWNTAGLLLNGGGNVNGWTQFNNFWGAFAGVGVEGAIPSYDDRAARGGPAVRLNPGVFGWMGFDADNRRELVPGGNLNWFVGDGGASWRVNVGPRLQFRGAGRVQGSVSVNSSRRRADWQWVGNVGRAGDPGTAYTFATLDQHTHSITARFDFTASPTLSLQVYAQPFVTTGRYSNLKQLDDPRAASYEARFQPYPGDPGGFNVKQFRSNVVVRWEYLPGSTLFAVWQQGRAQDGLDNGSFNPTRDFGNLFRTAPDNTFLLKFSYWFSR